MDHTIDRWQDRAMSFARRRRVSGAIWSQSKQSNHGSRLRSRREKEAVYGQHSQTCQGEEHVTLSTIVMGPAFVDS